MSRRVVVTGGFGFIGPRLVRRLAEQGDRVSVIDDLRLGSPDNLPSEIAGDVEVSVVNLEDGAATRATLQKHAPDVVYHLAAIHFIPACNLDPRAAVTANVAGTQSLLDACQALSSLETIVLTSSGAVYAPDEAPHREDSLLGPTDIYGYTKLWNEQQGALFHHANPGVGVAVARLFNVFGPGETNEHLIPTILRQALEGDSVRLGNLDTFRDYVFIDDVVEAFRRLTEAATADQLVTYNVGSGLEHDGHAVLVAAQKVLGRELRVVLDDSRQRTSDRPHLLSDCSRAGSRLGWSARVGLEEGLRLAAKQPLAPGSRGA